LPAQRSVDRNVTPLQSKVSETVKGSASGYTERSELVFDYLPNIKISSILG
jgi:hypothetical protein